MRIKNTYEREIEGKPLNNIIFSASVSLIIILVTGFFGVKPTYDAISQNIEYKEDLTKLVSNMETKLKQIQDSQTSLEETQNKIQILNDKIPTNPDFQKFLEQLVAVTSKSDFVILSANQQTMSKENKEYTIGTKLNGQIDNLPDLLRNLETNMPRFVSIERVRTQNQPEEDYDLVEIVMKTYTL